MAVTEITDTHQRIKSVISQRNILLLLGSIVLFANIVLTLSLFGQKQRTIIIPANLKQEIEFVGSEVSVSYLEEMTTFFTSLLLDLTPTNIDHKSKIILRYVEPSAYHNLQHYLDEEIKKHKEYNLTTSFSLTELRVIPELLYVDIYGVLTSKFGIEGYKDQDVVYRISYKNVQGKLLVTGFSEKKGGSNGNS